MREQGLSEDEDLSPDKPSGLFKQQVFRSLLHKAKITTGWVYHSLNLTLRGKGPEPQSPYSRSLPLRLRRSPVQSCSRMLS